MNPIAIDESETVESLQQKIGAVLGLGRPVSEGVVRAVLADHRYGYHLIQCKETPVFLNHLLEHPPTTPAGEMPCVAEVSNGRLLAKAANAFLRWGLTGFQRVDDATFERRMAACRACPHLVLPPRRVLYALATIGTEDENRVCELCGCVAARKARLPTETCPASSIQSPLVNRWGEPIEEA
jgi:hypothetical protein